MKIEGKVCLVTGATSGIGYETALSLKEKGAIVIGTGRNDEAISEINNSLLFDAVKCDSGNEDEVLSLFSYIKEKYGTLHVLINNAAYGYFDPLVKQDLKKFEEMFKSNVTGAMLMGREAARIFTANNYGNIINISSTAGTRGFEGGTAYASSKFALRGMTECWRAELRKYNVRVILINPSEVQTKFARNAGFGNRDFNPTKLQAQDIVHAIVSALEMEDRGFITELTVFATNPSS